MTHNLTADAPSRRRTEPEDTHQGATASADPPRTSEEWQRRYRALRECAERIQKMRRARLNRVCREAGFGEYHGCVLHNALIAAERGQPWRGIDYSKARRARRIADSLFEPSRVVARWAQKNPPVSG
jgi:hypothetical protein